MIIPDDHHEKGHNDEDGVIFADQISFNTDSVDGVRSVAHDHAYSRFPANFHAVGQGVDEGVIAGANVLDIKHQVVDIGQLVQIWGQRLGLISIKAEHIEA